ncbi:MAG TPA: NAD(P)-binding domain-containing protein [Blastocatellia bacterium]|nr:NAD(P)-binding domain-containing protein [Blastocatellia bacterium]
MHDLIIIGSGPAGLSAALAAKRHQLDCLILERGVIGDTVYHYPIARPLFSTSNEVELELGALPRDRKPTREEVLAHYARLVIREQLDLRTGEGVETIARVGDGFLVRTAVNVYRSRAVLVATGGFGRQRRLNVTGECPERVSYRFSEAHPFATKRVLVVGGGNSAAEAALFMLDAAAHVTLAIRRYALDAPSRMNAAKIKPWVREPLERAQAEGRLRILTSSEIVEILPESALLHVLEDESPRLIEVPCDHIFALIGADPDVRLLEGAGAEIAADGRPVYSDEFETTVPGLFVAGHLTRELHMKKAIEVGAAVIQYIAECLLEPAAV